MKKSLKITLSILLLVLVGYFGYTHFKKTSVLLNVIHEDAESVIKVGVHDITKTIVLDALSSPSYYWKNTKTYKDNKKDDSKEDDGIGVDLKPYAMAFYTIKHIDNTIFTTFKIDDIEAFKKYIDKYAKEKSSVIINDAKGYKKLTLEKSKLMLAWNSEKIAVALTLDTPLDKLKTVFEDVLLKDKLISDKNHDIIKKLSSTSDHIVFVNKESLITLNFKDKGAIVHGDIYTKDSEIYKTSTTYNSLPEASLQLYFDANFNNKENEKAFSKNFENVSFFSKNNIEVAELANRTNGFFSAAIIGRTTQLDTIISYDYDDNFEKVAVKKLQEKEVPKITINLGVNENESLDTYLKNNGAIANDVLLSIPYYTFYAKENNQIVSFNTTKEKLKTEEKNSASFFKLDVDFNHLQKDITISRANDVFALLETLNIEANQLKGTNKIKIVGNLLGKNEDVNIISQIFFGLQKIEAEENSSNENI
ncbi:hypothetical protein [uncultured Winogradskyella sp.]|uniref:hypothetical protein n=1 Tax=uncultured Winogradskyella sp. TaxID=395353 RepID=UPI0030ED0697